MKTRVAIILLWFIAVMISLSFISRAVDNASVALVTTTKLTTQSIPSEYETCIPIEALYQDGQTNYIFVLDTRLSFMGEELVARKVLVGVQEVGGGYAALDVGAISSQQEVIVKAIKPIQDGDKVVVSDD